ncbi:amyloid-beta A4 precursor protein-binding family A member 3 [Ictalurus furcatus]|uniref:amyloid-beta A4 precursor protein-binding family A member 3 n=1 Tax=Ictalurus furcatus TaxID=66913 RepID=UPI00234FBA29|nr:amyloid-beta A4 precursor protein-binding family A member 3 [Ictalurus furcatus]XP_053490103.1 amyloid-beta A4 precursor protein-binding family A member 3 [Ictalurus furcatus]XP_053490104.1 amyloid-beta A4 precursor protein-binding family A member 3 [Ictalurus furcatus]
MEKQADITHNKVASTSFKYEVLESSTQAEARPKLEDLDLFNPIEPPPLDWRSDSSSEACSLRDIEEPGSFSMETPLEELSDYGASNTSFTPTEVENLTSQVAEELPNQEVEDLANQNLEDRSSNMQRMNESDVPEPLEKNLQKVRQTAPENLRQHDLDHAHIQDLLNQLQLFHPTPPSKDSTPEPEKSTFSADHVTKNSSCLVPNISAHQICSEGSTASGLLFTVSNQRELLQLLEDPEPQEPQEFQESQEDHPIYTEQTTESNISQLPACQTRYITRRGEADEMVSVSYGSAIWHSPFQDELMMSGYSEDELTEEWQQSKCVFSAELASHGADVDADAEAQASYKDVPGPCDPEDLLDGIIFGAKYLGSTQLQTDRNPSTNARMAQAQEAVDRIKAPEGESQPMTEVDLFISTQRIKVLSADTQEAMMDHPLQMISYIADIGSLVVLMVRRKPADHKTADSAVCSSSPPKKCWMICHVFSSGDAQIIAQAIGQAFGVAYQQFLQANGIKAGEFLPGEYCLGTQELYNGDLVHFSQSENIREVCIIKKVGEILGLAVVESGWGSILPTVVVANLLHGGAAERSGELSIGDRIMSVNGASLVGLPITTCHNIIRDLKNQSQVKLSIVHCPPVTMAIIKRPDPKYQLGFSVEDGIICSLMRGGIAERGGIRVGHRIIEINGQSVVATPHEKIIHILTNAVGEIHLKTMPTSTYRLLTGQEQPLFL